MTAFKIGSCLAVTLIKYTVNEISCLFCFYWMVVTESCIYSDVSVFYLHAFEFFMYI